MLRIGTGQYDSAWRDIRACFQLANHLGRSPSGIRQTLAAIVRESAGTATLALLSRDDLPRETIGQIRDDLMAMPLELATHTAINTAERWGMLKLTTQARQLPEQGFEPTYPYGLLCKPEAEVSMDAILERINSWHDRALAAAHQPTTLARIDAALALKAAAKQQSLSEEDARDRLDALDTAAVKGELVGDIIGALAISTSLMLVESADRGACNRELLKLAAALATWRAAHGAYPQSLHELTPDVIQSLPVDPYSRTGESFHYERRDEGFLLYSVYLNGVDDDGTDAGGWIVKGERVDKPIDVGIDGDREDLVVRSPLPPFKRPALDLPSDAPRR
jgi:hypothetical protein